MNVIEIEQGEELELTISADIDITVFSYRGQVVKNNQTTDLVFSNNDDGSVTIRIPHSVTKQMEIGVHTGDIFQFDGTKPFKLTDISINVSKAVTTL